jgi:O-glycosyl hydrolase
MKNRFEGSCILLSALAAVFACGARAATVTLDPSTTYQRMEGIGLTTNMSDLPQVFQSAGVFYQARPLNYEFDRICLDAGLSGVRLWIEPGLHPSEGVYDWKAASQTIYVMREMVKRGTNRFLLSTLSPPGWMKDNGTELNGGHLKSNLYDDYTTFITQYCKVIKDSVGVEPYALSIQNEPLYAEPYASCVYTDATLSQLADMAKPKLRSLGLSTRIVGPEDVFVNAGLNWPTMRADTNVYGYAGHVDCTWSSAAAYVNGYNKKLWLTEWDIGPVATNISPTDYMTPATRMLDGLSNNVTWWSWCYYVDCLGTYRVDANTNVDTLWVQDKRFEATKQFARFIRPDAVRIGCAVTGGSFSAIAFKNPGDTFAVVIVNSGSAATVDIAGAGLPSGWRAYRTTGADNCANMGTSSGAGIAIAASSVTTITSGGPIPDIGPDTTPVHVTEPTPDNTIGQVNGFGDDSLVMWINGTLIPTVGSGSFPNNLVKKIVALKGLPDTNVIACYVRNRSWGGGLLASMMLPHSDTLHTDASWKVTYKNPAANPAWNGVSYDDSHWVPAKDAGAVTIWPGFARMGNCAVNMYYQNAHWILGGQKTYLRKTITFSSSYTGVYVRGNNFNYKVYIDGVLRKQGTEFSNCGSAFPFCLSASTATVTTALSSGTTHCIGYEIADASADGNGVLFKGGISRTGSPLTVDTTWLCNQDTTAGWSSTAYTDTSSWIHPDTINAYDPSGGAGHFIYPGQFWFRKKFTTAESTQILGAIGRLVARDRVMAVGYFTIDGKKLGSDRQAMQHCKTLLIRRTLYASGRKVDAKIVVK